MHIQSKAVQSNHDPIEQLVCTVNMKAVVWVGGHVFTAVTAGQNSFDNMLIPPVSAVTMRVIPSKETLNFLPVCFWQSLSLLFP